MSGYQFPNESDDYRARRDALLDAEVALREQTEAVAELRRQLPLGGRLAEDYRFKAFREGGVVEVPFGDLFGDHDTLLLYSMMFGPAWDAPCPACTSIVDAMNANHHPVAKHAALAAVSAAGAEQIHAWASRRGWSSIDLVSGAGNSYLLDYCGYEGPSETPSDPAMVSIMNVFRKTPDGIFHFWGSELVSRPRDSGDPRHVDIVWPLWNLLDMTPTGRGDIPIPVQDYEHRYFSKHVMGQTHE